MLTKTTYSQFARLASEGKRIIVYQEFYGDLLTPTQVFQSVVDQERNPAVLLEFSPRTGKSYSFIGFDPIATFSVSGQDICIELEGEHYEIHSNDPFKALRQLREKIDCHDTNPLLALTGGAVGYMSYDAIRLIEAIPDQHHNADDILDINLTFYGSTITFDPKTSKIIIAKVIHVENDLKNCFEKGMDAIHKIAQQLKDYPATEYAVNAASNYDHFDVDISNQEYSTLVNKAKEYINKGDIFQVVSSRTFSKKYSGKTFNIYRALKYMSPSPYHFYLQDNDATIVGASPEKIISLHNGTIESTPLAGTRARNMHSDDKITAEELMKDPKEISEHMMLLDLARNDIGSVSKAGSVRIIKQPHVINFSHVMHIGSTLQAEIAEGLDALDVLKATFPAGTLSGAPKIRAMEIIDELEKSRRGIYGGAILALDRNNNLDTCIAIRSAVVKNGFVKIRAGGGIVHDSDPISEAEETRHKARSVMSAIQIAEGFN